MCLSELWLAFMTHDKWPHKSSTIRSDEDVVQALIVVDGDELLDPSALPQEAHIPDKLSCLLVDTYRLTVQEDQDVLRGVKFITCHQ